MCSEIFNARSCNDGKYLLTRVAGSHAFGFMASEKPSNAGEVAPPTRIPCNARAKETLRGGCRKSRVIGWSRCIRGISVGGATELRGQHFVQDPGGFDTGQAHVEALIRDGEALVVDSEQMQHRCVQVADVNRVLGGVIAEFIGVAV